MGYNLVILCSKSVHNEKKAFLQVSGMLFYYSRLFLGRILLRRGGLCLEGGARRVVLVCYGGFEGWSPRLIELFSALNWL